VWQTSAPDWSGVGARNRSASARPAPRRTASELPVKRPQGKHAPRANQAELWLGRKVRQRVERSACSDRICLAQVSAIVVSIQAERRIELVIASGTRSIRAYTEPTKSAHRPNVEPARQPPQNCGAAPSSLPFEQASRVDSVPVGVGSICTAFCNGASASANSSGPLGDSKLHGRDGHIRLSLNTRSSKKSLP